MYLQRRRRRWYALHDIPGADVQKALGRVRFVQSLETEDHATAKRRAAALEMTWRGTIEDARRKLAGGATNGRSAHQGPFPDAEFWRKLIRQAPSEEQRQLLINHLDDELDDITHRAAMRAGVEDPEAFKELPERIEAAKVFAIATGGIVHLGVHLEEYLGTLQNEPKSVDMKRATINRFSESFPYVTDVRRREVQRWVNDMISGEGKAVATVRRSLSELRGYWSYLMNLGAVPEDHLPFEKLTLPRSNRREPTQRLQATVGRKREPFEPSEVVLLLEAAEAKGDHQLANLIRLGMWTGARIEELCGLRATSFAGRGVAKAKDDLGYIAIEEAKTSAGVRKVPIHSQLRVHLECLCEGSTDGYVLSGLSLNKYGDRSNAVGKRFGRLKRELGFGEQHVFHSIRKTVATMLENAGVPEGVSADILGHDKPTMTYGLYSGGASVEIKRQAIEKLAYPIASR